jgi:hypothetical protein
VESGNDLALAAATWGWFRSQASYRDRNRRSHVCTRERTGRRTFVVDEEVEGGEVEEDVGNLGNVELTPL